MTPPCRNRQRRFSPLLAFTKIRLWPLLFCRSSTGYSHFVHPHRVIDTCFELSCICVNCDLLQSIQSIRSNHCHNFLSNLCQHFHMLMTSFSFAGNLARKKVQTCELEVSPLSRLYRSNFSQNPIGFRLRNCFSR